MLFRFEFVGGIAVVVTKLKTPFLDFLPPLSSGEFEALKNDVKLRGVLHPICVDEDGNILDGHHRYKVDKTATVKVIKGLSEAEKIAFVLSSNNKRRNMTPEQKGELRKRNIETSKLLKEEDPKKWTQARIAVALGVAQQTVDDWLNISNTGSGKAYKDARISVSAADKVVIVEQARKGAAQKQLAANYGISQPRVSQIVKASEKKAERFSKQKAKVADPQGKFGLILCDPPWQYDFAETSNREIENQYPTMTVEELEKLKVPCDDDCVLLLWATAPKLREAFAVIDAWGFEYKTHAIWDKKKIGMGYWFRGQHELLLVATRGQVSPPEQGNRVSSIFSESRTKHSAKPKCVYEWIESAFPDLAKCEMFCRSPRDGFAAWGNEV